MVAYVASAIYSMSTERLKSRHDCVAFMLAFDVAPFTVVFQARNVVFVAPMMFKRLLSTWYGIVIYVLARQQ